MTDARKAFLNKKPKNRVIEINIDGEPVEMTVKSVSEKVIRETRAKHPPRDEDKDRGLLYNSDTFPAEMASIGVVDPKLSLEEWNEIWESDSWSPGELRDIFDAVMDISLRGFGIPFGESDSEKTGN